MTVGHTVHALNLLTAIQMSNKYGHVSIDVHGVELSCRNLSQYT